MTNTNKPSIVTFENVSFSYSAEQPIFEGLSFSLAKGDFAVLLGENGSGKSTLIKLLLGRLTPTSGNISIYSQPVLEKKNWLDVGYVPQKIAISNTHPAKVKELIRDSHICSHLKIDALWDKQFKTLSGGQQQKVLVALALEHNPDLLILDEPTVGIDSQTRTEFYELLSHLAKDHDKTVILVTHDGKVVDPYVTKRLCIDKSNHFSHARCVHD